MKRKLSLNPAANRYQVAPRQAMQPTRTAGTDRFQSAISNSSMTKENIQVSPGLTGSTYNYTVGIENGEVTAQTLVFSDSNDLGLIGESLGVATKGGSVTISGTDGTDSYAIFGLYARAGIVITRIHMTNTASGSASTGYFDSGNLKKVNRIDPSSNAAQGTVPLASLVTGADQNTNIRVWNETNEFAPGQVGFLLSKLSGYSVTIPAGEKVVFSFTFQYVAQGVLAGAVL